MAENVLGPDATDEAARARDLDPPGTQLDVDGLVQEVVAMDQAVQHCLPRRPPGQIRHCQLAEPAAIEQGEREMRLESLLQRIQDGYHRAPQVVSDVVPGCRRVADEDDLVLRRPAGQGCRAADQEQGRERDCAVLHQTQVSEELVSRKTRQLRLAAVGGHPPLQARDLLAVQVPQRRVGHHLGGRVEGPAFDHELG